MRPVSGLEKYDADFYMSRYNKNSASEFIKFVGELEHVVQQNGWNLETRFTKSYCGFKAGVLLAFGVQWIGTKTFAVFVKLPEAEAKGLPPTMTRYESQWKQALYYVEPGRTRIGDFVPLLEKAYRRLTGD